MCQNTDIYNVVLNFTTWCTSIISTPCTLCHCLDICALLVSLFIICLSQFLVTVTSLHHSLLSFTGRSYILLHLWLKMCMSSWRRPFLHTSICNIILKFNFFFPLYYAIFPHIVYHYIPIHSLVIYHLHMFSINNI